MAALLAGSATGAQQLLDRVLARVGTTSIMLSDADAALGLGLIDIPSGEDPRTAAVGQLIDRELALAEVDRFAPPEPDEAAIEQEAASLRAVPGAGLAALMQRTGLNEARLRELARDNLRLRTYLNQRFGATVQVTDEEVVQYFRANEDEFTRDGMPLSFEEAEPLARQRASAQRRAAIVAQWLGDLRARGTVTLPRSRP